MLALHGFDPRQVLMIGDREHDMIGAASCGVTGIGAAWGYHEPEELIAAGAVAVATHPLEVLDFARRDVDA